MNITLRDLVNSEQALAELAQADVSARMSFTLALVLKEIGTHLDAKRAAHQKLLEKYGAPIADRPGFFEIGVGQRDAFEQEYKDLLDAEVELHGIGKIKVSSIESEGVKLSGQKALSLFWLLTDDVKPMFEES